MWNKKRQQHSLKVFLGFLVFGVGLGFVENMIAVRTATDVRIDWRVVMTSLIIVIPFAGVGELIVDKVHLLPNIKHPWLRHIEVFLEFLVFGVMMGVFEDLIVIGLITGAPITLGILGTVVLVTLPFAILGEVIIDRQEWFSWVQSKRVRRL